MGRRPLAEERVDWISRAALQADVGRDKSIMGESHVLGRKAGSGHAGKRLAIP